MNLQVPPWSKEVNQTSQFPNIFYYFYITAKEAFYMQWNTKFRFVEKYQVFSSRIPPQCQRTSSPVITHTPEINK